jgi:solute:Na+ symporter, SSS family
MSYRVLAIVVLVLGAAGLATAEPLVKVKSGAGAPIPARITQLLTVNARPVAVSEDALWVLRADLSAWERAGQRPGGEIVGTASGRRGLFFLGARGGPAERIEALDLETGIPRLRPLPPLPVPLDSARGAFLADTIYVAGTAEGQPKFLALDTSLAQARWVTHPAWPAGGELTSLVAHTGAVFVTLRDGGDKGDRIWRWKADEDWKEKTTLPGSVMEGAARPIGQAHVLYLTRAAPQAPAQLVMFHTITGSWATLGEPAVAGARLATAFGNGIAWAQPGANGAATELAHAQIESGRFLLSALDWFVIVFYLVSMLGMGLYFYLREKRNSTSDFFVGGRSIPFWAAGISLYAANTSSISYIAIPAKAFETNWQYLTNNLVGVLGLMFVAVWIVPVLRRLDLMSVFHYIETRFHPVIRTLASALYIIVQIGSRMSVILFLPSLAIATMTGLDVTWSILVMAVFTMIYTALGGMKAVVWTDFVQLIVKMGGIAFAIGFVVLALDGGAVELFRIAAAEDKMKLFDFSFDLTKATVWGFVFLVLFDVVLTFPKDQVLMQRVLSTKDSKDAGRSIWTFAAVTIPGGFMFYFVGTALYAFYKTHPERMNPLLTIDATFPLFIAAELPTGIRGLIVAGILAAAMATLSSIMNSVATLASVDFYEKLVKRPNPKVSVRFAEAMTVVTGLLGMGVALLLSRYDIHSLFDISIELFGVLGGGFAGVYTLGMFTRRANWQGVAIGVAASILLTMIAWSMSLVHPYFYLAISILLCILIGYCASWLFPAPTPQSLKGLTIYEPKEMPSAARQPAPPRGTP